MADLSAHQTPSIQQVDQRIVGRAGRVLGGTDGVTAVLTLRAGRRFCWRCPPIRCGGRGSGWVSLVILTGCARMSGTARRSSVAAGWRGGRQSRQWHQQMDRPGAQQLVMMVVTGRPDRRLA
jgi:hypothetical protein